MTDPIDDALTQLMRARHSISEAEEVLIEYINDLQEKVHRLEAENENLKKQKAPP